MATAHNGTGNSSASRSASHRRDAAAWHFGECFDVHVGLCRLIDPASAHHLLAIPAPVIRHELTELREVARAQP
jgi:hypothetical protein